MSFFKREINRANINRGQVPVGDSNVPQKSPIHNKVFDPKINDVTVIKIIGIRLIKTKNNNFLSFKFILILYFETVNTNITKKGIRIKICFPKNIIGLSI